MLQLIFILARDGFYFDSSMTSRGTVLDTAGYSKPFTKSLSAQIDFFVGFKPTTDILGVCGRLGPPKTKLLNRASTWN